LRNRGWIDGANLAIEKRSGSGNVELLQALASELVQLDVEVIVAFGAAASLAAKNATSRIPIVSTTGDPVRLGLVAELSRPAGNITGVSTMALQHAQKRLELLRELLPSAVRIGELVDPADSFSRLIREDYEQVFRSLAMRPIFVDVASPADVARAFTTILRQHAEALLVRTFPISFLDREHIMSLASQSALPTVTDGRHFVVAGGLISHAPAGAAIFEATADLVDKILKGAIPAELPVQQTDRTELVINLKTARGLRLTIPEPLLMRANEVIH